MGVAREPGQGVSWSNIAVGATMNMVSVKDPLDTQHTDLRLPHHYLRAEYF
ncbi:hypothetical protein RhiXN_00285 [Rhizoctonia solani]|uniref:Uncharacterized protein n=1 Tax=Rhizoctonia solani TaxID=456999 RepID=A0A8H8SUW1_9AGAM|nr:uncharacterized protein RhiXN_00285 [Rhizoctonia solani]QRW18879.1 hypothetical protein RhiXN_00285 [Rhizoctonia solani]